MIIEFFRSLIFVSAMPDIVLYSQNQNQSPDEEEKDQLIDRVAAVGVNLPSELIYKIACRLLAKSVGRFRCVSKDWKTLLSNPTFLKNQFLFNIHHTKIIVRPYSKLFSIQFRNDCSNSEGQPSAISEVLNLPFKSDDQGIHGSCNGLILFYDYETDRLSIVNPITRELCQLPPIPQGIVERVCEFGFGYCLSDDEYTVIIVSDHTRSSPVYVLKKKFWKRVEDSPLLLHGSGAFVTGSIHWCGYRHVDKSIVVCAFDLASERFWEVEKPEGLKKEDWVRVDVLGGCLCLVHHGNSTTDIWVMKKYGYRDSWTKYVAYTSQNNRLHPLFFWNFDESIVAASEGRLILYCLKQKTSAIIPVIGEQCPEFFYRRDNLTFVDSLFPPNCSNALEG